MDHYIRQGVLHRPDGTRVHCYAPGDGHLSFATEYEGAARPYNVTDDEAQALCPYGWLVYFDGPYHRARPLGRPHLEPDPMSLIDSCIAATGRVYPDGYGMALGYLTESPGPTHFMVMRNAAWRAVKPQAKLGNRDAAAFVSAYVESVPDKGWRYWLIEAAQLVRAEATAGRAYAVAVMRLWSHPGY